MQPHTQITPTTSPKNSNWTVLNLALKCLNKPEQWFISKFIHEWLRLQDHYHVTSASANNLCPSCHISMETVDHFLTCPHHDCQDQWHDLHNCIYKIHFKYNVGGNLHKLLSHGLYIGWQTQLPNPLLPLTELTSIIYQEQTQISWKQIFYGRFAVKWMSTITATHPQVNGTIFCSQILTEIWHTMWMQWTIWNKHLHPPNHLEDDRTQLHNIVYQILHDVHADPLLQDFLSSFKPDVLLWWPNKYIQQWIKNSTNHIKAQRKAFQLQAKLHTQDIQKFFTGTSNKTTPATADKNLHWPP